MTKIFPSFVPEAGKTKFYQIGGKLPSWKKLGERSVGRRKLGIGMKCRSKYFTKMFFRLFQNPSLQYALFRNFMNKKIINTKICIQ